MRGLDIELEIIAVTKIMEKAPCERASASLSQLITYKPCCLISESLNATGHLYEHTSC